MPHTTESTETGVHIRFHGTVSFDEIFSGQSETWEHPDYDNFRYVIVDFIDVETLAIDEADAQTFGFMDNSAVKQRRELKMALVAVKPEIIQLFEAYASTLDDTAMEARIFTDRDKAIAWAKSF